MFGDLVSTLTDWIPWLWLQNLAVILIYMAVVGAMSVAPFVAWLAWQVFFPPKRTTS
jgi:hypothetical protein